MSEGVIYVPSGQHQTFYPSKGVVLRLLHSGAAYQTFLLQVEPRTVFRSPAHDGEELRFVISGDVIFEVHEKEYRVGAGGTLRHPSSVPHGFRTEGKPASFITFTLSCTYDVARVLSGSGCGIGGAGTRGEKGTP